METHIYFNAEFLPEVRGEYIAWCDGMGTGRTLSRSLYQAANSVFKLHSAFSIAQSMSEGVRCYAVMDGVYVTCASREGMCKVLRLAFCELGREFINKPGIKHMHMIRAGLAFGPVIHGMDVEERAFHGRYHGYTITRDMFKNSQLSRIRHHILLSPAMVLAYRAEKFAPPFGIYVDNTAKCYQQLVNPADTGFESSLSQWWAGDPGAKQIARDLYKQIKFYLDKCETHSVGSEYPRERIRTHRELAEEYFGGLIKEEIEIVEGQGK